MSTYNIHFHREIGKILTVFNLITTLHLEFSKLLGTLSSGKICICLLRIHYKKRSEKDLFDDDYAIFLIFFIKAYVVGTHLNCIDKSIQFK